MSKGSNQKLKMLYLLKILSEKTDESHCLSAQELIGELQKYEVSAERKSIYNDIECLTDFGYDIVNKKAKTGGGYYLASREFELPELKLLVDAVQSSRFITQKKSRELIHKIETLAGPYEAKQLQRQVFVQGRIKTMNETIYYGVDDIHRAISENRKIRFKYYQWNIKKELVPRHNGDWITVSPWALTWDDENYYLVAYDGASGKCKHYRVDKMADLAVTFLPLTGVPEHFDMAAYAGKHFGMFSGREGQVTLRCRSSLVGVVLDRFGLDAILIPDGESHFTVTVSAVVSPQFLGWLFGLGDGVQLLRPQWAVEELRRQLSAVAGLYPEG